MKITNLQVIGLINCLKEYMDKKIPQQISYAITQNYIELTDKYKTYEVQLKKLFQDYRDYLDISESGDVIMDEDNMPKISDEVKDEFQEQLYDLLNIEVDISLYQIDKESFNYDNKNIYESLSPKEIIVLQKILCEGEL